MLTRLLRAKSSAVARYLLWAHYARKDAESTREFAQLSGIRLLNIWESPILQKPSEKVLFILGSGSSINDLTESQLAHIGEHQSIGINFWYFHDFVPNVLSFDGGGVDEGHKDIARTLEGMGRLLNRKAIVESRPWILYLRPLNRSREYLLPTPKALAGRRWVSARANVISSDSQNLESDIRLILKKIAKRSIPPPVLPDNGSSVVRMIFLGLAQGYKDFVLTGVDLDDRAHFWASQDYVRRYKEYVAFFPNPGKEPHGTTQAIDRPLGNLEFLALLGKVMKEERLGNLWLASPASQLAPFVPQYQWPPTPPETHPRTKSSRTSAEKQWRSVS